MASFRRYLLQRLGDNTARRKCGGAKHYLQVTDDHFRSATKPTPEAAQQAHVGSRTESQPKLPAHEKTPILPEFATGSESLHASLVPPFGLEPKTY